MTANIVLKVNADEQQESSSDVLSQPESLSFSEFDSQGSEEDTPKTFCIKFLLFLCVLGFLLGGAFAVSSNDAALVDFYYPDPTNPKSYGRDMTVTLFFDGVVCKDGACYSFEDDPYVCDGMKDIIAKLRGQSMGLGIMMLGAVFVVMASLFAKSIAIFICFVSWKLCRKKMSPAKLFSTRCRSIASKTTTYGGLICMLVILAFAIVIIDDVYRIAYAPLCESNPEGTPKTLKVVYNVSLADMCPDFSFGRALNLNLGAAIIVCVADGTLILWFIGTCCYRFSKTDIDSDDEAAEEYARYEARMQQDGGIQQPKDAPAAEVKKAGDEAQT